MLFEIISDLIDQYVCETFNYFWQLHRRVPLQKATLAVGGSSVLWGVVLFVSGIAYIKAKNSS